MDTFRNMASAVRQRLFRHSVRQQTRNLDPVVRTTLVDDICQDENDLQQEFQRVEQDLEAAKVALSETEKKETFLGQRSRQYRLAVDERARVLRDEQRELLRILEVQQQGGLIDEEENIEERKIQLDERMEKWERDEDALTSVIDTHKVILAECERMRRKIKALELKRNECRVMAGEVGEFIQASVEQDNEQTAIAQETELSTLMLTAPEESPETDDNADNSNRNNAEAVESENELKAMVQASL